MLCWTFAAIFISAFIFGLRAATDFSTDPPRFWHKPRSYGHAVMLLALLWAFGWFGPVLWKHRYAFDSTDWADARRLWEDSTPLLPAGLGITILGIGIWLTTTAWSRVGSARHCRRCGYERAAAPQHELSPTCPECGAKWSRFGALVIGTPRFSLFRATCGAGLITLGAAAIIRGLLP